MSVSPPSNYPEAMTLVLEGESGQVYPTAREKAPESPKPFVLPERSEDMRRVCGYLMKYRHIEEQRL